VCPVFSGQRGQLAPQATSDLWAAPEHLEPLASRALQDPLGRWDRLDLSGHQELSDLQDPLDLRATMALQARRARADNLDPLEQRVLQAPRGHWGRMDSEVRWGFLGQRVQAGMQGRRVPPEMPAHRARVGPWVSLGSSATLVLWDPMGRTDPSVCPE
jgi:hypothetical protein